jgi:hypothetical protein
MRFANPEILQMVEDAKSSGNGQEVALAPVIPTAVGLINKGFKAYGAFKGAQTILDGGKVNSGLEQPQAETRNDSDPLARFSRLILRNDY